MDQPTLYLNCYHVRDAAGNVQYETCQETGDTILFDPLYDENGENQYFESDAYHLADWCKEHGFDYRHQIIEVEIPNPFDLE